MSYKSIKLIKEFQKCVIKTIKYVLNNSKDINSKFYPKILN